MRNFLLCIGIIFMSCSFSRNEINLKKNCLEKEYKKNYETEIFVNSKCIGKINGAALSELFNKDKSKAIISFGYNSQKDYKLSNVLLIKSENCEIEEIFHNVHVALQADENLTNLFVVDYDSQKNSDTIKVFIYDVDNKAQKKELFISKPSGGYALKEAVYENGLFKFQFYNDFEESEIYSISVD